MSNRKQELKAQPSNLAGLIDYQKGSVVSRTIIDKKTGTITLFAFDEGQGLSEHTTPYDRWFMCLMEKWKLPYQASPSL